MNFTHNSFFYQVWDDELARVAQKWSDQCADVDYKGDYKRQDPLIKHDKHPQRKVGELGSIGIGSVGFEVNRYTHFNREID